MIPPTRRPDPTAGPDLPRVRLFDAPSPLHRLPRFSAALGDRVDLWIKREDLLPLAFGGNKLRNLEFLVGAALAEGADTLVTSGRRWSNHCRLTAAAGTVAGLRVELVLSGPTAAGDGVGEPAPGVRLMEMLGATVHQLQTDDRGAREAAVRRVHDEARAAGRRPFVIGVGGSGPVGAWGQVLAAEEAFEQAKALGVAFDAVVLPSATGGTQAGLTVGTAWRSQQTQVTGVLVARPEAELRPAVESMVAQLSEWTGAPVSGETLRFDVTQLGEGYGHPTAAAADAARLLASTEGILVDPIYTAKALAGLTGAVRAGRHDGQTVLFWHAGGTPGLFESLGR